METSQQCAYALWVVAKKDRRWSTFHGWIGEEPCQGKCLRSCGAWSNHTWTFALTWSLSEKVPDNATFFLWLFDPFLLERYKLTNRKAMKIIKSVPVALQFSEMCSHKAKERAEKNRKELKGSSLSVSDSWMHAKLLRIRIWCLIYYSRVFLLVLDFDCSKATWKACATRCFRTAVAWCRWSPLTPSHRFCVSQLELWQAEEGNLSASNEDTQT